MTLTQQLVAIGIFVAVGLVLLAYLISKAGNDPNDDQE